MTDDAPTITPHQFLRRIWRLQRAPTAYAFLTWFDDEHSWHDSRLRVIEQAPTLPHELPNDGIDLYFAPCLFSKNRRRKPHALPGRWLYADLDEVDPRALHTLKPTVAWETSPGRYQAMWLLKKPLPAETLARLNQQVTYFTEADKGGWSLTKVLRLPGTTSHKRDKPAPVSLLWMDTSIKYDAKSVHLLTRSVATPLNGEVDVKDLKLPKVTPSRILKRRKVSARIRKLYKAKDPRGDRSQRLWQLENLLLKAGCTPEETLVVVRSTVWNKYKGQRREVPQLWAEISKAASSLTPPTQRSSSERSARSRSRSSRSTAQRKRRRSQSKATQKKSMSSTKSSRASQKRSRRATKPSPSPNGNELGATGYDDFLGRKLKRPGWLVDGIWSEKAHGVLAGEAKTYKSVISTDLAVSVASGTPFLGTFSIPATGPVLMIQEENDEGETQDRLRRIAASKNLTGSVEADAGSISISNDTKLPIHLLNNTGFNLTDKEHLLKLARFIKANGIKLVVLDPFYLMTPGVDENSAHHVGPVLRNLLRIKQSLDCGILLIHHYKKQNIVNPIYGAARMSGTGVFHRWFESAVYVEKIKDQPDMIRLLPDHRGHRPQGAVRVRFDLGTDEDLYYKAHVKRARADSEILNERLMNLLDERDDWTLSELRLAMGIASTKVLKQMLRDRDYTWKKRKTGGRGRPTLMVIPTSPGRSN